MAPDIQIIGDPEPSDAEIAALARLLLGEVETTGTSGDAEREVA
jgi:hypothetical protein